MSKIKKILVISTVLLFSGILIIAGGPRHKIPFGESHPVMTYAKGEVLVKFKKGLDIDAVENFIVDQSLELKKRFDFLSRSVGQQIVLLKGHAGIDAKVLADALSANPNVEYAHPNYRRELCATPNDPRFSELWGLHNASDHDVNAPAAWDTSTGSSNVIVAVIDTGFDYTHPDLAANAWTNPGEIAGNNRDDDGNGYIDDVYGIDPAGWNGSTPDCDPMDGYGHGTHCAGTIGAVGNNSLGVVGVNWNVKIMGLKFMDESGGSGYDSFSIECIEYAVWEKKYHQQNVVAINASWGGYATGAEPIDALRDAIEFANDNGIVFCAAAGNDANDNDASGGYHHYPSDYTLPGIISVAATDNNDELASFSNYGATSVDLGAPGVSIVSTVPIYVPQAGDIFFDNMEGGSGQWTTGGTPNSWGITDQQEGFANVNFPVPSPTHFWSDSPNADYAASSNSWVMNNTNINLTGYVGQKILLGFGAAWGINSGDHGLVEVSTNGGTSWTTILDQAYDGYVYYWSMYQWVIPDSYKTANFRIRFRLISNASSQYDGFLIDDVGIGFVNTFYQSWGGTSMATPHVAGAVALNASVFPSETVAQRKKRILENAEAITSLSGYCVTGARLDLEAAVEAPTPTPDPAIRVTSPDGGEVWIRNTVHSITWTSEGTVGNVNITFSQNSGSTWTSVATNEANDGIYSWTTPAINRTTCRVRVQETDGSPSDMSDANFSIVTSGTETVSTPATPDGPATGSMNQSLIYMTRGSESSLSDPVQYYFDWGDGNNSGWLAVGTTMAMHSWAATGNYNVRARARCAIHTAIMSSYSANFPVIIYDEPTWAAITRFTACEAESFPTVEWHTGTEAGTVGFYLWRQDKETKEYELANPYFLPALPNAPQGGFYRLADPGALSGEPMTYKLEEVDAQGRRIMYGPFTVTFGASWDGSDDQSEKMGREEASDIHGYQRFRREPSTYEQERLRARQLAARESAIAHSVSKVKERGRITVKGEGLFYVSSAQVADSLGFAEVKAASLISGYRLSLTGMGKEIAWLADANGAGIFFHNQGLETEYSDKNVYFLEQGSGLAMETMGNGNAGPAPDGQTYRDTLMAVENHYFLPSMEKNTLADSWFWDYVVAGSRSRTFTIIVPGLATTGQATLRVVFRGATDTAADNDHHAVVTLNGSEIGSASWDGGKDQALEVSFSASKLVEGANTIVVSGMLDMGAPYSIFYVDGFELGYPRYYKAENNTLLCRGDGNSVITVSGITEPEVVVLDVSKPIKPKQVIGVAPDLGGRVTFVPRDPEKEFLVSGLNAALRPLSVVGDRPARLKNVENSAEYVVIAPEEFEQAAEELADYRKGKGLKAMVVTLEDIYDSFNYGMPSPYAIHEFLAYAYGKWSGKKLKYAVLAGKGTYDYKDYQGHGDNLVPAVLAKSEYGYYAADRVFGDVVGKNLVPEIAIGRLPAVTAAELRAMIDKVKAYENGQGDWASKAIFIADNGNDFFAGSDGLAALATGFEAEKVYLDGSAADERERIATMWSAGAGLVNYCGHGGMMQLAEEELLDVDGARELRNGDKLPLLVALTCVAGRFEVPGYTSLGEALALSGEGGMAGGLVPSGAGMHADSMRLGEGFYRAALSGKGLSAGQALVKAMKEYVQNGGSKELLNIYNWLGDPALKFK